MPSCNVTDDHLRVVSRFRDLQRLDLSGCDRLTDAGIRHLARGCTKLQALVLSGCPKISDNALELLTDHCPLTSSPRSAGQRPFEHLQTLDLSETDISDSGVDLVRSRCPHIEQFVANHCYRLSVYPNLYEMFATSCAFQPAA
ncbi:hypothetical protein BVRB_029620 [Beta vulgaris subsp. vulgaris]|uniref:F-box/LRR-repeat protein 15-like leucin rich repeat domain-containing protein n=1 Tax=Beta vulgaris subsp. vulgaris TaxID=3555 RepID=A0A0J8B157_BETVV|nr:hypothetical protein BVRB_029620 [Beta vulgaris subsp. vulgaris]